ncbi:serine/Arginine-related protein 53 [Serinus canaria]|uniref:serine/Arginine-related protein 53 n=1 Tax=Serinus canaria TaxID=9135 RepID=UPI0021CD0E8C|nr:serine/Arginine-related protein 53 [Serinus canaria]
MPGWVRVLPGLGAGNARARCGFCPGAGNARVGAGNARARCGLCPGAGGPGVPGSRPGKDSEPFRFARFYYLREPDRTRKDTIAVERPPAGSAAAEKPNANVPLRGGERRFLVVLSAIGVSRHLRSGKKRARSTGGENTGKKEHHRWLDTDSPGRELAPAPEPSPRQGKSYRSQRSRSKSRTRRSRQRSYSRSSERSGHRRTPSGSRERRKARDKDKDKAKDKGKGKEKELHGTKAGDSANIKAGLEHLTPAEQAKARLQLVLEAAAKADEALKAKERSEEEAKRRKEEDQATLLDQVKRVKEIEAIESDAFVPQTFRSSKEVKKSAEPPELQQEPVNVGAGATEAAAAEKEPPAASIPTAIKYQDDNSLAHPNLFMEKAEAEEKWFQRLVALRQERLMGSPVA